MGASAAREPTPAAPTPDPGEDLAEGQVLAEGQEDKAACGPIAAGQLARLIAAELLAQLQPGLGPMVIPAEVSRVIGAARGWHTKMNVAPSADDLWLEARCLPDGSLYLALTWQGGNQVWSGVLRPPAPR